MSDNNIIENSLAAVELEEGGITESASAFLKRHEMLGCNVYSYYTYGNYDVCNGWGCRNNS